MTNSTVIEFEGAEAKLTKAGVYHCPYNCGTPGYPRKKWKTEKGFRKHMESCRACPSAYKKREQAQERKQAESEVKMQAALADCPLKIGDTICYVRMIIVSPTHKHNGTRSVRVRYEAVKRYKAASAKIESFGFDYGLYINDGVRLDALCESMEDAAIKAKKQQESYDKECEFAAFCR